MGSRSVLNVRNMFRDIKVPLGNNVGHGNDLFCSLCGKGHEKSKVVGFGSNVSGKFWPTNWNLFFQIELFSSHILLSYFTLIHYALKTKWCMLVDGKILLLFIKNVYFSSIFGTLNSIPPPCCRHIDKVYEQSVKEKIIS